MEPTIPEGSTVLVTKVKTYRVGDVVALLHPNQQRTLLKRITKSDGKSYEVLGDNRKVSTDSRSFGALSKNAILGKVVAVI